MSPTPSVTPAYRYRAHAERVIDGDTYQLHVDLGFRVAVSIAVRLRGVNAPEINTRAGKRARDFATRTLRPTETGDEEPPVPLIVETYRDRRSFARWVADVYLARDGRHLADLLIENGHADPA